MRWFVLFRLLRMFLLIAGLAATPGCKKEPASSSSRNDRDEEPAKRDDPPVNREVGNTQSAPARLETQMIAAMKAGDAPAMARCYITESRWQFQPVTVAPLAANLADAILTVVDSKEDDNYAVVIVKTVQRGATTFGADMLTRRNGEWLVIPAAVIDQTIAPADQLKAQRLATWSVATRQKLQAGDAPARGKTKADDEPKFKIPFRLGGGG